ncbi:hypothetical protein VNO80_31466 [Phaseolus coccineus]|uniref:Uncharacterized protein n=1 Tax=Phaseolus coccineus TaxID=3886 RepID=A0AAN9L2I4_PHACN
MCKCRSHGTFPLFGLQSSHLNICYYHQDLHRRPLRPGSRPGFYSDRRALLLIGAWSLPRRPADFDFHDHRPAVLIDQHPLWGLDERFARQYRCGPPPEFPLASPRSGIVHHLSGPDRYALTRTLHRRSGSVGGATHRGIPPISFLAPYGFTHPLTRTHVRLLGPCFKTGRMGSPQADARSAHVPRHAMRRALPSTIATMTSPRAFQQPGLGPPLQSASVNVPSRSADRLTPFHIRPGHIAGPHPLPSRQFQALFDSLFKVLFIFPSRYLFAIGLSPVFSLGRNLPPDWGCIPKQPDSPTAPRGATGSGHNGALTLSGAPFQGTWARSATEDASPDYNSNAEGDRFSWWAFPGSLAVTRGILVSFFSSAY